MDIWFYSLKDGLKYLRLQIPILQGENKSKNNFTPGKTACDKNIF